MNQSNTQRADIPPGTVGDLGQGLLSVLLAQHAAQASERREAWHPGTEIPPLGIVLTMLPYSKGWVPMLGRYSVGRAMWHVYGPDGSYDVSDGSKVWWMLLPEPPSTVEAL